MAAKKTTKKTSKRVTMGDVAQAAGVSKPVVSAILKQSSKNNSRFSKETMDKVLKIVRELNYRPNRTARKFVQQQHNTIGLLFSHIGNIGQQTIAMMAQWSAIYDFEVILERAQPNELPRFLTEDMVDCIVVFEKLSPEIQQEIEKLKIPLVCVNTDWKVQDASYILFDEEDGIRQLMEYFLSKGKTSLMMLEPFTYKHYSHALRRKALEQNVKKKKMIPPVYVRPQLKKFAQDGGLVVDEVGKELAEHPGIDCIIVNGAQDAICVYDIVKQSGREIPGDISVACIRKEVPGIITRFNPQLTHLNIEENNLGRTVVLLVNDIVSGKSEGSKKIIMPYTLEIRES